MVEKNEQEKYEHYMFRVDEYIGFEYTTDLERARLSAKHLALVTIDPKTERRTLCEELYITIQYVTLRQLLSLVCLLRILVKSTNNEF